MIFSASKTLIIDISDIESKLETLGMDGLLIIDGIAWRGSRKTNPKRAKSNLSERPFQLFFVFLNRRFKDDLRLFQIIPFLWWIMVWEFKNNLNEQLHQIKKQKTSLSSFFKKHDSSTKTKKFSPVVMDDSSSLSSSSSFHSHVSGRDVLYLIRVELILNYYHWIRPTIHLWLQLFQTNLKILSFQNPNQMYPSSHPHPLQSLGHPTHSPPFHSINQIQSSKLPNNKPHSDLQWRLPCRVLCLQKHPLLPLLHRKWIFLNMIRLRMIYLIYHQIWLRIQCRWVLYLYT